MFYPSPHAQITYMETHVWKHYHAHPHVASGTQIPKMINIILGLTSNPLNRSEYMQDSLAPSNCLFTNSALKATVILPTNKLHKMDPSIRKKIAARYKRLNISFIHLKIPAVSAYLHGLMRPDTTEQGGQCLFLPSPTTHSSFLRTGIIWLLFGLLLHQYSFHPCCYLHSGT